MGSMAGGRAAVYWREHRDVFLAALREGYSVRHAAERAGPSAQRFYQWRQQDEASGEESTAAIEAGTDLLEDEAHRRAVHGVPKDVWHRGERVGEEIETRTSSSRYCFVPVVLASTHLPLR